MRYRKVGDKVTLPGWPARSGKDEMSLSTTIAGRFQLASDRAWRSAGMTSVADVLAGTVRAE